MSERVAIAVLWRGGAELIMEERWMDTTDGGQETLYAFPGGKIEEDESEIEAVIREVREETGISLNPEKLKKPEEIDIDGDKGYIFQALLPYGIPLDDGSIVVWTPQDLLEHKIKGKLMPLTDKYVKERFIFEDEPIDN